MLWTDSLRETYSAIYKTVKTAKPAVPVGWHIWHNNSFNPIYRAEQDLHELSNYSDFIKIVMYNNCGGERMALYADNIGSSLYGDLSKQGLIDFNYALMGFKERSYDQIPHTGLSPSMRRPVGVKSILFLLRETSLFSLPSGHCRHASIRTLEERLFRSVHIGRSRYSRCCHLIIALWFYSCRVEPGPGD